MTKSDIFDACKELCGNPYAIIIPDSLSFLHDLAKQLELHDRDNLEKRVKWINNLRKVVGRRIPKNKSGTALTSDIDLMCATGEEMCEAILRTFGKWKD